MRDGEPGWFYVGNGQLRYKDSDGWTDKFQDIGAPGTTPPTVDIVSSDRPGAKVSSKTNRIRRRVPILAIAVCVGLLGIGLLNANIVDGWGSWASIQAGQISAMLSPPAPTAQPIAAKPKAKAKAKAPAKAAAPKAKAPAKAAAPKAKAPAKAAAPRVVEPEPVEPVQVTPRRPSPAPVTRHAPSPMPTTHTRTAADCLGNIVAISEIRITATTATLVGTVTNETGLDANLSVPGPVVETWDTNSTHERLYGDFRAKPDPFGGSWAGVLHPGQSISYHSLPVTMQTPDRNWDAVQWSAINQFDSDDDQTFCQQRWI